ncbi:hypothetical protein O3W44_22170 [Pantoea sp. LMR881]|uniref:hypothetical protein n=1 Tax=Pantoea sp. LMR881 TaxID=3014336 RepID=UPI0022AFA43F|nr:hypothetical protein [Pantoea sp. LMR881]MCZ4061239.1 hypothetical protein [Pantoea sp. LMR881]
MLGADGTGNSNVTNMNFQGGVTVGSAGLEVKGGGSFNASLTLGYRQMFQRANAPGYQSFSRTEMTSAPSSDTEIGRVLFGYGMTDSDSWGTGAY